MRINNIILKRALITIVIYVFIVFYLLFLVNNGDIQEGTPFKNTFIFFMGITLLIVSLFLIVNLNSLNYKFRFWFIPENLLNVILLSLIIVSFFIIPSITFSSTIIAWQGIGILNLIRAVITIIGCAIIPGSCLFHLIFPRDTIHERFGVDSLLIKITLYPILSFITLGFFVLVIDQIGFTKEFIPFILIFFLIFIFFLDILVQKLRKQNIKPSLLKISLSKHTIIILFISLGVVLFSGGILLNAKYLIPGDSWVVLGHANYIGLSEASLNNSWVTLRDYPLFWAYPTFALSVLSGLPFINTNVLLTPFLYLFVTSLYLLMKTILHRFRDIYAILATFFTITFTGLTSFHNIYEYNQRGNISSFIFDGLVNFRYKSFSIILFFAGLAVFFIIINENIKIKKHSSLKNYKILGLGALFLVISYATYMFPLLIAFIIIIIYFFFKENRSNYLFRKQILHFLLFIVLIYFILDISMNFYLSRIALNRLLRFFSFDIIEEFLNIFPGYFIIYLTWFIIIFIIFILNLLFYIIYKKKERKLIHKNKKNSKLVLILFPFFIIIFTIFLTIYIISILDKLSFIDLNNYFIFFFLNEYFFPRIGIIGIVSILLSYFCYKSNKNLFLILIIWIFSIFVISSILFIEVFLSYFPDIVSIDEVIKDVPIWEYRYLRYLFTRTWYYTIPAFSILLSVALIEVSKRLKNSRVFRKKDFLGKITKNIFISFYISISFTILMIAGLYWQNLTYSVNDDEAQVIGWVSTNIPDRSSILIDAGLNEHLTNTLDYNLYKLRYAVEDAYNQYLSENNNWWFISYNYDENCNISLLDEFKGHKNVLELNDNNPSGRIKTIFNFNEPQTFGTIEYIIYSTNRSNKFWVDFSDRSIDGPSLWNGYFVYYDGNDYVKLKPYESNSWYHIILKFECSTNGYEGLNQYEWSVIINGTEFSNLPMYRNVSQLDFIGFGTETKGSNWQTYLDVIDFSWYPNFQMESFIFQLPYMEDYILKKNITYYIHTTEDTWYKRDVENEYLNIMDLINYFFPRKEYEFGSLSVYSRDL